MADAAISFAVQKLGEALIEKVKFVKGVEEHVRWLKDELKSMQCFVKDAAKKQDHDERIRKWISDVREVAQDAEDVIEAFTLKVEEPRKKRGVVGRCFCFTVHVPQLNRVGEEIESIRTRLDEIGKRRERYGIGNLMETGMESLSRRRWEMVEWRRRMATRFQKDRDVVGLNEDTNLLLKRVILREDSGGLCLAAIVGMGGIGKSTLARKIYNHPSVAARFEWRAWVVVSSEFAAEDIIKQIMLQLPITIEPDKLKKLESIEKEKERQQKMEEALQEAHYAHMDRLKVVESMNDKLRRQEMLQEMLYQRLQGKRYFIVLDDVWEHTHWEALTTAFPNEQDKASRVVLTSRNQIITKRKGYIHEMRLLNPEESWELFLKTALIGSEGGECPQELEHIGREILNKCHGLPLAITVAGGLLVNEEETERGWKKVLKQMKDYHLETSEIGMNVSAILELSYHNLPSQLKPCFLTLGLFKEDAVIRAKRLVHIWVAQGFVELQEVGEETEEEIATGYLDELMRRNLVQVKEMTVDGRVNYCHVHDLLRELSIKKAKEEIGFETSNFDGTSSSSPSSSSYKPRHRVVRGVGQRLVVIDSSNQNNHLRSLFLHIEGRNDAFLITPSYWKSFQLLRILDIEGTRLPNLPSTIRALVGLRYLRLRDVGTLTLPAWLDLLKNLQVLDIADSERVTLPNVTWKMDSLRHLYIHRTCIFTNPMKFSTWKNLVTLKYIRSDNLMSDNPFEAYSHRLRKLGVQMSNKDDDAVIGRLLVKSDVEVLHIRWNGYRYGLPFSNSLEHLIKLKLHGLMVSFPTVEMFPPNISHLTLSGTRISGDGLMQELGKLPKLRFLSLEDDALLSIRTYYMRVLQDGFPKLKVLRFRRIHEWSTCMHVEEGGMPELQQLEIYQCPGLDIGSLTENLRSVEIIVIDD